MTEFWVSQGNKWCDFCKIYISNNAGSIRNHEMGQRHKDSVAKRLSVMREEKVANDKQLKEAARAIEQIEAKAQRSYQKDIARVQEGAKDPTVSEEWEYESSSGYYYNQNNGCYYDAKSGFYYTDNLGRWVTEEEALASTQSSSKSVPKKPILKNHFPEKKPESSGDKSHQSGPAPGRIVSAPLDPTRSVKGAPSSLTVNSKRKRETPKPKAVSGAESAALKAREAARKRVEEREKSLLGLYKH